MSFLQEVGKVVEIARRIAETRDKRLRVHMPNMLANYGMLN